MDVSWPRTEVGEGQLSLFLWFLMNKFLGKYNGFGFQIWDLRSDTATKQLHLGLCPALLYGRHCSHLEAISGHMEAKFSFLSIRSGVFLLLLTFLNWHSTFFSHSAAVGVFILHGSVTNIPCILREEERTKHM